MAQATGALHASALGVAGPSRHVPAPKLLQLAKSIPVEDLQADYAPYVLPASRRRAAAEITAEPDVVYRLYAKHERAQREIEQRRRESEGARARSAEAGCTFQPDITRSQTSNGYTRVYTKGFLERQQRWVEKKKLKDKLRREIEEIHERAELTFAPEINGRSRALAEAMGRSGAPGAAGRSPPPGGQSEVLYSNGAPGGSVRPESRPPRVEELRRLMEDEGCYGHPEITRRAAAIHYDVPAHERLFRLALQKQEEERRAELQDGQGAPGGRAPGETISDYFAAGQEERPSGSSGPSSDTVFERLFEQALERQKRRECEELGALSPASGQAPDTAAEPQEPDLFHSEQWLRDRARRARRAQSRREAIRAGGTLRPVELTSASAEPSLLSKGSRLLVERTSESFYARQERHLARVEEKRRRIAEEVERQELQEASFEPDTSKSRATQARSGVHLDSRARGDVYATQELWLERRNEDLERLREKREQEIRAREQKEQRVYERAQRRQREEREEMERTGRSELLRLTAFPRSRSEVAQLAEKIERIEAPFPAREASGARPASPSGRADKTDRDPILRLQQIVASVTGAARPAGGSPARGPGSQAPEEVPPQGDDSDQTIRLLQEIGNGSILNACTVIDSVSAHLERMRRAREMRRAD